MNHRPAPSPVYPIIVLFLSLLLPTRGPAQELISVEAQEIIEARFLTIALPFTATYDVATYKMLYTSRGAFGQPDTLSGLVALPLIEDQLLFPLTVYNHGTVTDREAVPSRVGVVERLLPNAFATSGYVVVAPDYIGLGDSRGFHPYLHAETEARAGRDMIVATKEWFAGGTDGAESSVRLNDQLFITGYSQGGHAAQALHRDLQLRPDSNQLTVTAATHLSGPYSISEVMRRELFSENPSTLPAFVAYTYLSYNRMYELFDSLAEAFVPPYLSVIDSFDRELIDGESFNTRLTELLNVEENTPFAAIFQDSIREQLRVAAGEAPVVMALRDNDTYEWAPLSPTLIYYCTEDEQVPPGNAILADSVMRLLGATDLTLTNGGPFDHGGCIVPAATATLDFFNALAERDIYVGVGAPEARAEVSIMPNPVRIGGSLLIRGLPTRSNSPYLLYDGSGRLVAEGVVSDEGSLQLPSKMQRGLHLLRIQLPNGNFLIRKLILH